VFGQYADTVASASPVELDPQFLLNTFAEYRWKQFGFGVGVSNLLDEQLPIAQPFHGGAAPIPLKGREFFAKLTVHF
jgi:hypothetical protein